MRQLSSADWTMLSLDTATAHNTIGIVGIYDPAARPESGGPITYEEVLKYIEARLHVAESFRERLVNVPFGLDRPWWIRDGDFDLEYHVRHIALPQPGSWRQLCTQIARIHARPLDLTRPPWELYLIDGLNGVEHLPEGAFAVFLRVHHAAIDGVAGAEILTAIHTREPDEAPPPAPEAYHWEPDAIPGDIDLLGRAALHGAIRPFDVLRRVRKMVPELPSLVTDTRDPDVTSPASLPKATRFNQIVSPHRVFGTAYTTLDVLKEIRTAVPEATINDVGVAIVGGAIRRYLLDKGELPDEAMVAMMPISIRPTTTRASGTATSATSTGTSGNEYSIAPITMATDETDPLERLTRIVTSTAHVKESGAHPVRSLIAMSEEAFGGLMGTVQRAAVRALSRSGRTVAAHTLVSNVPGPLTPMYFCGAQMVDTTGLGPVLDGMGLNNGIGSYGNRVTFCFTADRAALPDPEVYEQCLSGAVDELLDAARARTKSDGEPRKRSSSRDTPS
ncbi:wax ester/triacylglycerol synthase family O-acyltransferase [Mycobacterium sp. Y57]|uniref:wax ester/triacylglycerol synthase family O-acyltransferase n=1 Tax=Mycolicibacterium xanthum TaxID=2796469 RepID=UPI001C859989|nr:wax ester/triacylglycerol synthase family O-acyltransferase [Mycolicibacterium xanthum]MBX7433131.1 wax ester/triacylglycerol synthase family O-acyltransferase [Mycolicibacterium xanthum]